VSLSLRTERLLTGSRGWTTVTVLSLSLVMLVGGHAGSGEANAGGLAAAPSTPAPALVPVSARSSVDRPVPTPPAAPAPAPVPPAAPAALLLRSRSSPPPPGSCSRSCRPVLRRGVAAAPRRGGPGQPGRRGRAHRLLGHLRPGPQGLHGPDAPAGAAHRGLRARLRRPVRRAAAPRDGARARARLRHHPRQRRVRAAYQAARGIPASTPWYGCSGCTDFATPAGDFAEVYAQWVRGSADNRSELAGDPGPAELAALAAQFFGG
jgi:hypothetical protein